MRQTWAKVWVMDSLRRSATCCAARFPARLPDLSPHLSRVFAEPTQGVAVQQLLLAPPNHTQLPELAAWGSCPDSPHSPAGVAGFCDRF
ncbi:MAG: hypothetical protein ACO4CG_05320 [Prochlorothrix sp.]